VPGEEQLAQQVVQHLLQADAAVNELLGISLVEAAPGRVACRMTVADRHVNSQAVCHGGIIFALADTALAYSSCTANRPAVTLAASVSFTRAARAGDTLTAAAQVETQGQRAAATTVRITNQRSELIALVQATSLRLDARILPDASS